MNNFELRFVERVQTIMISEICGRNEIIKVLQYRYKPFSCWTEWMDVPTVKESE